MLHPISTQMAVA
jgi:ribonuclease HI